MKVKRKKTNKTNQKHNIINNFFLKIDVLLLVCPFLKNSEDILYLMEKANLFPLTYKVNIIIFFFQ